MGVDRSSLSSSGVARRPARATGDGLAVVGQQSAPQGTDLGQNDDFGSCNLDSIHQGGPIFEGPTCFVRRQERMSMSPIFSSAEPGPQLTWTAMLFETILERIERATVFVPDFTFVATRPNGQPTPNPNVLIEYGYALKCMSNRQFMPVMNTEYGEPKRENMPFDLIEHRNPITYNLPKGADERTRGAELARLAKVFESALRTFFESD